MPTLPVSRIGSNTDDDAASWSLRCGGYSFSSEIGARFAWGWVTAQNTTHYGSVWQLLLNLVVLDSVLHPMSRCSMLVGTFRDRARRN